jgi:holo-[acyl-carrier protein] synthase
MIVGIGLDIIEVERLKKSCESKSFLNRIFTPAELDMFNKRSFSYEVVAGNFAAKEATMKAFSVGFSSGFYSEIEVLREKSGKPFINLYGNAKKKFDELGCNNIFISLTNIKNLACAQVILEK